ncbi:hypothetical protein D515_00693 [Grimontia indica]|uniref:Uncharacterized protein n=1 Tax=Grimontia indica TaxID=1056512 RepID=R1GVA0_9GAMM|nr:hypothetical protein D515_00693 [Grimontia indica]
MDSFFVLVDFFASQFLHRLCEATQEYIRLAFVQQAYSL